jgi:hypothetical protein
MDLDKMTLGEVKEIGRVLGLTIGQDKSDNSHWKIGKNYFIRTVTHHLTGTLLKVTENELVVENAAWIADDGKFSKALATENFNEVEPFPDGELIIGRGSLIDAFEIKKTHRSEK